MAAAAAGGAPGSARASARLSTDISAAVVSPPVLSATMQALHCPEVSVAVVGEERQDIPCMPDCLATVISHDQEPRVWSSAGDGRIVIRDVNGEVVHIIENPSIQPTAMCSAVNGTIWVGRRSGKINVYEPDGTIVTELMTRSAPVTVLCSYGDRMWSSSTSKDVIEWKISDFSVQRHLFSQGPGDAVLALCPGFVAGQQPALFAATREAVRMWDADGREAASVEGGARGLVFIGCQAQLWAACEGGIVILSTSSADKLTIVKTLSKGRPVLQLLKISDARVWAIDEEQVTLYNAQSFATLQVLDTPPMFSGRNAFVSHRREVTRVWLCSDDGYKMRVWDAVANAPADGSSLAEYAALTADDGQDLAAARAEIHYLRKKIKYVQSVGTIFRQRIGILFREKFRHKDFAGTDWGALDSLYRQALTEASGQEHASPDPQGAAAAAEANSQSVQQLQLDKEALQLALNEALSTRAHEAEASPGGDSEGLLRHWKEKVRGLSEELAEARSEIERLSSIVDEAGPQRDIDMKRAHHICQVLKEKNALKEQLHNVQDQLEEKKKELQQELNKQATQRECFESWFQKDQAGATPTVDHRRPSAAPAEGFQTKEQEQAGETWAAKEKQYSMILDQMREDNEKYKRDLCDAKRQLIHSKNEMEECRVIRKQNNVLRTRMQKLRQQLSAQRMGTSSGQSEMQHSIEVLTANITQLQHEIGTKDNTIQDLSGDKLKLMQDISRMNTILERYKMKVLALEREQITRAKQEQLHDREHRRETQTLCESLDSRECKIQQLQANFVEISEQLQHQIQQVARTNHELDLMSRENMTLKSKLQQLDMLLRERQEFSGLLGEVQGRMEMAVEELKNGQSTAELAAEVCNLEQRVAGLAALESQLKQKDDCIALRDDELQQLRLKLAMFERNVNNISAVFLQFPHSIEEMELMIVENEEFRNAMSGSQEVEERIKLRRLDMEARRAQHQRESAVRALKQDAEQMGSLDAATAALLAQTEDDSSESDDDLYGAPELDSGPTDPRHGDALHRLASRLGVRPESDSGMASTAPRSRAPSGVG
eukprot:TRINITY_DN15984_c0_g1_i1.p1 TRINITY_DN15984_c0_g1~~TRINITY_DN15984_c0_g1_i1.p1  ORF type:complete len:1060 (+),score=455.52 TRINITY_DN15984_c0_g1_i1:81-3260(+)